MPTYRVTFTWEVEADDPFEAREKAISGHDDGTIIFTEADPIVPDELEALDVQCRGCGQTNPSDEHGGGHIIVAPGHAPGCDGRCRWCPVPVQELCGPVEPVDNSTP